MKRKISKGVLVALFVAVISFCTVISSSASAKDSSQQEGLIIPPDKCLFIDTHTTTEGVGDVGPKLMIDFPTYSIGNGVLRSWVQVTGFGENTKVLVGGGRSLTGTAGGGAATGLSAYDTDNMENLFYFDADATVHYYYNGDWRTVKVGETWTETVEKKPSTGDGKLIVTYTVKNYGFMEKTGVILPSPEFTPTLPATSTATATPTSEAATSKVFNISGYIKPSFNTADRNSNSDFAVEVIGLGKSTTTDENGFFEIGGIPVNSKGYSLKISKKYYLSRTVEFRSGGEDIQIGQQTMPVSMWVGDIVIDDAVNILDILEISKSFNSFSGDVKYNKDVDINKDGAVNIQDIMIVAANFNKVSSYYNNNEIKVLHNVKLKIGDTTRLALKESGPEGIKWEYEIENENIIKLVNDYVEEMTGDDPFTTHVWKFEAVAEGTSYLTFKSTNGKEETFLVVVGNNSVAATPTSSPTTSPDSHKINLNVGDITEISQNDCKSIGQEWNYYITDTRILTLNSEYIERESVPDDYCKHTWRFKAESAGTTYITFRSTNGRAEMFTVIVSKGTVITPQPSSEPIQKISLRVRDQVGIVLQEGGFAGISWNYEIKDKDIIMFSSENIESRQTYYADALYSHSWRFKGLAEGTTTITFKSSIGKEETFLVTVGNNSVTATPAPSPTPSPDSHKINLNVGDITEISQNDCKSIGQEWNYYITDTRILTLNSEFIEREPNPDDYCKHTWRFKAESAGTTYITFRSTNGRAEVFTVVVSKSTVITPEPSPEPIQEINLRVRDQVGIVLQEGGIGGVSWNYEIKDKNIIIFSSENIEAPQTYYADASYSHSWRFKGLAEGTTTITFKSSIGQTKSFLLKVSK